jgi:hypothetical protein
MRILYIIILLVLFLPNLSAQTDIPKGHKLNVNGDLTKEQVAMTQGTVVNVKIVNGDTLPFINLREFSIYEPRTFKNPKEAEKFDRLKRDVKKAYPYAKIAGEKFKMYNDKLLTIKTEKERKIYVKEVEKQMKAEFENDLRNLTMRQGRILIKLVDRETGSSSYELVKEIKGGFSAFMWQSVARVFGSNLKDTYDAQGDDKLIEEIVQMIEKGDI